jgi:hypothetical protein
MRSLNESATYTLPEESTAINDSPLNCPFPVPFEPHALTNEYCSLEEGDVVLIFEGGDIGGVAALTVTVTMLGELVSPLLSLTVRENFNSVSEDTLGAVNDGIMFS